MTTRTLLSQALSLTLCPVLLAQEAPAATPAKDTVPDEAARAAARAAMLARTGGLVQSPATGPAVLFLNVQKRTPEAEVRAVTDAIARTLRLPVTLATREAADPLAEAATALGTTNVAAVVVIADLPGQPTLLVAPEDRWALVNCAPLGGQDVPDELRAGRVRKEIWRAFGYLMGAAHSNFEGCLLKSVLSPADLDALQARTLCPEPFNQFMTHAQKLGIKPVRMATYRKAVEEGWAPAPTNDTQKAIWQEVKSAEKK